MRNSKLLIFTDASLEQNDQVAGIGMVAFVVVKGEIVHRCFFSERVPESILRAWQHRLPKVISALEFFAAVLGVELLNKSFSAIRTFLYVDNEAARASLISMYSPLLAHNEFLRKLQKTVMRCSLYMWTSRVPSASNPADDPSRRAFTPLVERGFHRMHVQWNTLNMVPHR